LPDFGYCLGVVPRVGFVEDLVLRGSWCASRRMVRLWLVSVLRVFTGVGYASCLPAVVLLVDRGLSAVMWGWVVADMGICRCLVATGEISGHRRLI